MKKGIKKKKRIRKKKEKCMELIVRALFCLTRGLTLGVTDIMKVSSPAFGKMMFYSSAIPTQAQPLGTSQPIPSTTGLATSPLRYTQSVS